MFKVVSCIRKHLIYLNSKIYFQYIISIEISKVSFFEFISEIRQIVQYKLEIELHTLRHPYVKPTTKNHYFIKKHPPKPEQKHIK